MSGLHPQWLRLLDTALRRVRADTILSSVAPSALDGDAVVSRDSRESGNWLEPTPRAEPYL